MKTVFLLLGSNQGDSPAILAEARRLIQEKLGAIMLSSALYRTAAWGKTDQPDFLNQVLQIQTDHSPIACLSVIHQIEDELGRQRTEHWGQRSLDIDILFYEQEIIHSARLVVPHPELHNRKFALIPLCNIAAHWEHPVLKRSVAALLADCPDPLSVFLSDDGLDNR